MNDEASAILTVLFCLALIGGECYYKWRNKHETKEK